MERTSIKELVKWKDCSRRTPLTYWLCLPCFLYILYYSIHGYKIRSIRS